MERLANLLGTAAVGLSDRIRVALEAELGLGGGAAGALVHLDAHPDTSTTTLGRVLGLSQSGAVRLVDRLAHHDLVARTTSPDDARVVTLTLTRAGRDRVEQLHDVRRAVVAQVLERLDDARRPQLLGVLEELVVALVDRGTGGSPSAGAVLRLCRLCDRDACRQDPGCPFETDG